MAHRYHIRNGIRYNSWSLSTLCPCVRTLSIKKFLGQLQTLFYKFCTTIRFQLQRILDCILHFLIFLTYNFTFVKFIIYCKYLHLKYLNFNYKYVVIVSKKKKNESLLVCFLSLFFFLTLHLTPSLSSSDSLSLLM